MIPGSLQEQYLFFPSSLFNSEIELLLCAAYCWCRRGTHSNSFCKPIYKHNRPLKSEPISNVPF